jgi:putative endonuclease
LYAGITTNLNRRFLKHLSGHGAKFTKANKPEGILWSEKFNDQKTASAREAQIKKWSRTKKELLIAGFLRCDSG